MGKQKVKRAKKGKDPAHKGERTMFTIEHQNFVCRPKKAGTKPCVISTSFFDRFGFVPISSTLSTLYNSKKMKAYEELLKRDSLMESVEVHIDKKRRPAMLVDLDCILMHE